MSNDRGKFFCKAADQRGLATPNMRYGSAEAEVLWQNHYGCRAVATKIASEQDAVFRIAEAGNGCTYLLRIAANHDSTADLQTAILDHIATTACGLPVPVVHRSCPGGAVVALDPVAGEQDTAFATSFLPGKALATFPPSVATRHKVFELLSSLDRSLEGFSHPKTSRPLLWNVANADQIEPMLGAIPEPALRELVSLAIEDWHAQAAPVLGSLRRQVIHNDFNPSNILVGEGGEICGIIDFGDVIEAPLICDLATAIAYQEPEDDFETLVTTAATAYGRDFPLTTREIAILPVLVRARAAMVVAITSMRANHNPDNRDYLLRNAPLASRMLMSASRKSQRPLSI